MLKNKRDEILKDISKDELKKLIKFIMNQYTVCNKCWDAYLEKLKEAK